MPKPRITRDIEITDLYCTEDECCGTCTRTVRLRRDGQDDIRIETDGGDIWFHRSVAKHIIKAIRTLVEEGA